MNGKCITLRHVKDRSIVGRLCLCGLGFLLLLQVTPCQAADDSNADTILIKNVRLIDREGQTEDQTVNILIKAERLEIVTQAVMQELEGMLILDGTVKLTSAERLRPKQSLWSLLLQQAHVASLQSAKALSRSSR